LLFRPEEVVETIVPEGSDEEYGRKVEGGYMEPSSSEGLGLASCERLEGREKGDEHCDG